MEFVNTKDPRKVCVVSDNDLENERLTVTHYVETPGGDHHIQSMYYMTRLLHCTEEQMALCGHDQNSILTGIKIIDFGVAYDATMYVDYHGGTPETAVTEVYVCKASGRKPSAYNPQGAPPLKIPVKHNK